LDISVDSGRPQCRNPLHDPYSNPLAIASYAMHLERIVGTAVLPPEGVPADPEP
jgi:hypothetical protein